MPKGAAQESNLKGSKRDADLCGWGLWISVRFVWGNVNNAVIIISVRPLKAGCNGGAVGGGSAVALRLSGAGYVSLSLLLFYISVECDACLLKCIYDLLLGYIFLLLTFRPFVTPNGSALVFISKGFSRNHPGQVGDRFLLILWDFSALLGIFFFIIWGTDCTLELRLYKGAFQFGDKQKLLFK